MPPGTPETRVALQPAAAPRGAPGAVRRPPEPGRRLPRAVAAALAAGCLLLASAAPRGQEGAAGDDAERRFHQRTTRALARGRLDEAQALAAARPGTDPSAAAVHARTLALRGRYAEAERRLAPAASAAPASAAGLELGLLLQRVGRAGEAQPYLAAVAERGVQSRRPVDQYRGGLAARALGGYRRANGLLRSAAAGAPGDPAIRTAWAELFLEKYNRADAVRSFTEALEIDDEWAPAHLGLARALADENPPAARQSAARALRIDPGNVGAHLFVAEQELGDRNAAAARAAIDRALEVNAASLEARALRAAMAHLDDRAADFEAEAQGVLAINPAYGDVYRIAGSHAARAYRFDEAAALVRRAIEIDPGDSRAHAALGMHLLRTGDEAGARAALERAFADDPFDVVTYNLLEMLDALDEFETIERGDLIVRLHPDEAPILGEYVVSLAQEALDTLSALYPVDVRGPILIEVFPRHDDFAVRNLGLPGMIGALGACFGRVVTMDSPRARPPGDFNWRATLWHEIAHVVTLQMSKQRVPRWLTEGVSVYEERRARAAWGRDQEMAFARALNDGSVLSLRDLNGGFSRPETISLAYFQASVVVEHVVDRYGEEVLHALIAAYGDGLDTEEALASVGLDFDKLQASFDAAVDERFGALREALRPVEREEAAGAAPAGPAAEEQDPAERIEAMRRLAERHPDRFAVQFALGKALRESGDLDGAAAALERASTLAPMATGIDSPRGLLAAIAQERGDAARAMRELERLLEYDQTSLEAARQLAALAEGAGDEDRMALAYDRIVGIDPFDPAPHLALGRMALARGDAGTATRELTVALAAGTVDRVSAHCDLAESHLLAGEPERAKRAALAALEMAPTYERAQELLLRAVEAQP